MSYKLTPVGAPYSTIDTTNWETPIKLKLSGDGSKVFVSSKSKTAVAGVYEGIIGRFTWLSSWQQNSSDYSGGYELWDEGISLLQISKNGASYAWGFKFKSPNGTIYTGIETKGAYFAVRLYPFEENTTPRTYITTTRNMSAGARSFSPWEIRFSDKGDFCYLWYKSTYSILESLTAPGRISHDSTLGNLLAFEISGDGLRLFSYLSNGNIYVHAGGGNFGAAANIAALPIGNGATSFCANYDGSIVAVRSLGVKIYQNNGSGWSQLGDTLPDGDLSINSTGTLVKTGFKLYFWTGTTWEYKWDTVGAISDDGNIAVTVSENGDLQRYELKNVAPIYYGGPLVSSIYAGSTEGKQIYYGPQKLWP